MYSFTNLKITVSETDFKVSGSVKNHFDSWNIESAYIEDSTYCNMDVIENCFSENANREFYDKLQARLVKGYPAEDERIVESCDKCHEVGEVNESTWLCDSCHAKYERDLREEER